MVAYPGGTVQKAVGEVLWCKSSWGTSDFPGLRSACACVCICLWRRVSCDYKMSLWCVLIPGRELAQET